MKEIKKKFARFLRQDIIEAKGTTILRIPNSMIKADEKEFLRRVQSFIKKSIPSPSGRGDARDWLS